MKVKVILKNVEQPVLEYIEPVLLSDATIKERKEKVLQRMQQRKLDAIVIYADMEHASNFEYLCGFVPRFEEALLVLHLNKSFLLLGNEVLGMAKHSRLLSKAIHVPQFSLPDQPLEGYRSLSSYLEEAEITSGMKIGVVGWKKLSYISDRTFDVPHYIVEALLQNQTDLVNATDIFIGDNGARTINNVNEIRHYEYGQVLAANGMLEAMNALEEGKTEREIASLMEKDGQRHSVVTVCSFGQRFENANIYPGVKKAQIGDELSMTVGYKGGLSSRAGYLVKQADELREEVRDYIDVLAGPYFSAIAVWLEQIHVGMTGQELYHQIEQVLPKEKYRWSLNPGHLCADEEWLCSPVKQDSTVKLENGMLFQIDIIPSLQGYAKASCENGIVLAYNHLRKEIQRQDPDMWKRFCERRQYIENVLNIKLNPDVMPLSSSVAYLRPYLLNKNEAFCISKD